MMAAFLIGSIFQRQARRAGQPFRDSLNETHGCDSGRTPQMAVASAVRTKRQHRAVKGMVEISCRMCDRWQGARLGREGFGARYRMEKWSTVSSDSQNSRSENGRKRQQNEWPEVCLLSFPPTFSVPRSSNGESVGSNASNCEQRGTQGKGREHGRVMEGR